MWLLVIAGLAALCVCATRILRSDRLREYERRWRDENPPPM